MKLSHANKSRYQKELLDWVAMLRKGQFSQVHLNSIQDLGLDLPSVFNKMTTDQLYVVLCLMCAAYLNIDDLKTENE